MSHSFPLQPDIQVIYGHTGNISTSTAFVFDHQLQTYANDKAKIAFIVSLLTKKASSWAVAISSLNAHACSPLHVFTNEICENVDHLVQGWEASSVRALPQFLNTLLISTFLQLSVWEDLLLWSMFFQHLAENVRDKLAGHDETPSQDV